MAKPKFIEPPPINLEVSAAGGHQVPQGIWAPVQAMPPSQVQQVTVFPPLDGAGILVQPSHALQGGRIGQQVWGEAGIFHHEEHINQLFEGALRRPSQGEYLGWPSLLPYAVIESG